MNPRSRPERSYESESELKPLHRKGFKMRLRPVTRTLYLRQVAVIASRPILEPIRDRACFHLMWVEGDDFRLVSFNLVSVSLNVGWSELRVSFNLGRKCRCFRVGAIMFSGRYSYR